MFHEVIDTWFRQRFGAPTAVQAAAWPVIASGKNVLATAPTGSGKTLAAFLACLDRLLRQALDGALENRTSIVYITPLKALSNDVKRNLEEPLAEIVALARQMGLDVPPLRAAVRTGDTTAAERQAAVKKPPHILVTTPESLYILLTSESGRRGLGDARTVIVDEIHAVAPDKRGAHLALSLERPDRLAGGQLQRLPTADEDAVLRPLPHADHDRGGRGQSDGAGAGDQQDGHEVGQREDQGGGRSPDGPD
jgi:Lhr-like helicase